MIDDSNYYRSLTKDLLCDTTKHETLTELCHICEDWLLPFPGLFTDDVVESLDFNERPSDKDSCEPVLSPKNIGYQQECMNNRKQFF